jgi:ribonuclease J
MSERNSRRRPRRPAPIVVPDRQNRAAAPRSADPFPRTDRDSIVVMPVGGIGTIGSNWTLYGAADRWILVDAGAGMPPKGVAGLQVVIPDPAQLEPILDRLVAIVVTHAHYDHIGGLPALVPYLRRGTRIYATKFAAECVRHHLERYDVQDRVEVRTFSPNRCLTLKPFTLHPIRVAHSSPEALAFGIQTEAVRILHTGDWRIDEAPNTTWKTDFDAVARFARPGLAAMVADSTCADRSAPSPSETRIAANFAEFLGRQSGLVVAACFSSHVDRAAGMMQAASAVGRVVFVAGMSLLRTLDVAKGAGILGERHVYETDLRLLESYSPSRCLLICTGSQGEENAILRRLADDDDRLPEVAGRDTVLLSSRVIPGNEDEVAVMVDAFRDRHVDVFIGQDGDLQLHASGHASRPEIETMLDAARPRLLIPVHGADHHLAAHVEIARAAGVPECHVPANGRAVRVTRTGCSDAGSVEFRPMAGVIRNERLVLRPLEVAVAEAEEHAARKAARRAAQSMSPAAA